MQKFRDYLAGLPLSTSDPGLLALITALDAADEALLGTVAPNTVPAPAVKGAWRDAYDEVFVDSVSDAYLTRLAANYGVRLPRLSAVSGSLLRSVLPILGWSKKTQLATACKLLRACFPAVDYATAGWRDEAQTPAFPFVQSQARLQIYTVEPDVLDVVVREDGYDTPQELETWLWREDDNIVPPIQDVTTVASAAGATTITVSSTAAFPANGTLRLESARSRFTEKVLYASKTATDFTLSTPCLFVHEVGVDVKLEVPASVSPTLGDFWQCPFAVAQTTANILAGDALAFVDSSVPENVLMRDLPTSGRFVIDPYGLREVHDYTRSGTAPAYTLTMPSTTFANGYASGTFVFFYAPEEAGGLYSSTEYVGGFPVVLYANAFLLDFALLIRMIKASGIVVRLHLLR